MVSVSEFKKRAKMDAHNHLNLGMRYASYVSWAGFYIPDFPRKLNGLDEMHVIIKNYTGVRCACEKDVQDLLDLSIQDAVADGVTVFEGSIDLGFIRHCGNNVQRFLDMVKHLKEKFKKSLDFRPELGMGKLFDKNLIKKWAPECIESGVFKSIDLYGPEVEDGIEDFQPLYKLAEKLGLKKKAHVGEFSNARSVQRFAQFFGLDEIQHGIGAATDKAVMKFLRDEKLRLHVCPASNVLLSAVPSLEEHPIKILCENGVDVTIATDDLLFFNKSISEECADLVNAGVLSKEQVFDILDRSVKK